MSTLRIQSFLARCSDYWRHCPFPPPLMQSCVRGRKVPTFDRGLAILDYLPREVWGVGRGKTYSGIGSNTFIRTKIWNENCHYFFVDGHSRNTMIYDGEPLRFLFLPHLTKYTDVVHRKQIDKQTNIQTRLNQRPKCFQNNFELWNIMEYLMAFLETSWKSCFQIKDHI